MQDGYKGVIQAPGRPFGDFNQEPWISLSGDDSTGAVTGGETIRVNGRFSDRIKRIAVPAFTYDGVPNWNKTNGCVRLDIHGQDETEVGLEEGRKSRKKTVK